MKNFHFAINVQCLGLVNYKLLTRNDHVQQKITMSSGRLIKHHHACSVADPDPGSGACLTPGSGMGIQSRYRSGMNIFDHISESLETIFWLKNAEVRIRELGIFLTLDKIRDGKNRIRNPG